VQGGKGPLELPGTEGLRMETLGLYFVCPAKQNRVPMCQNAGVGN